MGQTKKQIDVDDGESPEETHLEEIPDGAGCVGIWEHLSDQREDDD